MAGLVVDTGDLNTVGIAPWGYAHEQRPRRLDPYAESRMSVGRLYLNLRRFMVKEKVDPVARLVEPRRLPQRLAQ